MNKLTKFLAYIAIRCTGTALQFQKFIAIQAMVVHKLALGDNKETILPWLYGRIDYFTECLVDTTHSHIARANAKQILDARLCINIVPFMKRTLEAKTLVDVKEIYKEFIRLVEPDEAVLPDMRLSYHVDKLITTGNGVNAYMICGTTATLVKHCLTYLPIVLIVMGLVSYFMNLGFLVWLTASIALYCLSVFNSLSFQLPINENPTHSAIDEGRFRIVYNHVTALFGITNRCRAPLPIDILVEMYKGHPSVMFGTSSISGMIKCANDVILDVVNNMPTKEIAEKCLRLYKLPTVLEVSMYDIDMAVGDRYYDTFSTLSNVILKTLTDSGKNPRTIMVLKAISETPYSLSEDLLSVFDTESKPNLATVDLSGMLGKENLAKLLEEITNSKESVDPSAE